MNILLAHGSPRGINEYVLEDRDQKELLEIMAEAKADVLCVGHSHLHYHCVIDGKNIINIGTIGKPKDDNADGCYVILSIDEIIAVEFVRFAYDIETRSESDIG